MEDWRERRVGASSVDGGRWGGEGFLFVFGANIFGGEEKAWIRRFEDPIVKYKIYAYFRLR